MEVATNKDKRKIEQDLDVLEIKIAELRVLYEQHFSGYIPQAPTKEHDELKRYVKVLLNAPFKNTANRFRLTTLVHRFQLLCTRWEKIKKDKEEGKYYRDVFKAKLQEKSIKQEKISKSTQGQAEANLKQLFNSYKYALVASGERVDKLNYDSFKESLLQSADKVKEKTGAKKIKYQIVSVDGRVKIKTEKKE